MDHADHVDLLRDGVGTKGGIWADVGSGRGAFTLALAELIGPSGKIHSVDRDEGALRDQASSLADRFPGVSVHFQAADFTRPLRLPSLDGIVMANSLHFVSHHGQESVVRKLRSHLRPGGRLVIVEYNVDKGNPWVPNPISFDAWTYLATRCGFAGTRLLVTKPSRFLREIYSAVSWQ